MNPEMVAEYSPALSAKLLAGRRGCTPIDEFCVGADERRFLIAACANARSACVVAAEDDAERVADGIGEDPEARLAFTRDAGGAQGE
jgi:hypothetical protein